MASRQDIGRGQIPQESFLFFMNPSLPLVCAALFTIALLYASVGHAGASGYIAVLSLCGMAPEEFKPIVLILNIAVALIGSTQFIRAGHFEWRLFWPFALTSIPLAFLGGAWKLPAEYLRPILGVVLWFSALRLGWNFRDPPDPRPPSLPVSILMGAILGFVAGLTGTGGGIFLTPLILLSGWAGTKRTAATSVVFILVNSIAGLLGYFRHQTPFPPSMGAYLCAVILGGTIGSYLGSRRFPAPIILKVLAIVLLIAGTNLIIRL